MRKDDSSIPVARILVVDDDASVRQAIARSLELSQYEVDQAGSAQEALALLKATPYEVMILDMWLPDKDGTEIMAEIEPLYPNLKIIILTGEGTMDSAIAAVKCDAVVEYLLKPTSVKKVSALVTQALNEHVKVDSELADGTQVLRVPPFTLRYGTRQVIIATENGRGPLTFQLTPSQFTIFAYFLRHANTVLSCRSLVRHGLGYDLPETEAQRIIRPHICRLRKKVEQDPNCPRWIVTVPNRGYVLDV